jgi:hypothetical protein
VVVNGCQREQLLKREDMPDTGENREIGRRVNAKEVEVVSESKKLLEKVRSAEDKTIAGSRGAKKKRTAPSR